MNTFNEFQSKLKTLLSQKIGLNPSLIESQFLNSVIQQRITASGIQDLKAYWQHLQTSTSEFEALLDLILVPETWFFRNSDSLIFLQKYIRSEWLFQPAHKILRILSVPCSTGEEPYSIAIALIEAGLTPKKMHIDAVDISQKNLRKASNGVYKPYSFRGQSFLKNIHPYFEENDGEFHLKNWIKQTVKFRAGNLLDPLFLAKEQPYDIIFCRNLFIYFEPAARLQALSRLEQLLKPGGLFFVGCAETSQIANPQLSAIQAAAVFAFQKTQPAPPQTPVNQVEYQTSFLATYPKLQQKLQKTKIPQINVKSSPTSHKINEVQAEPIAKTSSILEAARKFANSGLLQEAAALCETCLKQNVTNSQAYLLLGEVHQAGGRDQQAQECFQKALYLEPNHYEALVHLALLKEQQGDRAGAAILFQRIQRLSR